MDTYAPALHSAVADVVHSLGAFAADSLFAEKFKLVFGTEVTPRRFRALTSGSALPPIEVVKDEVLAGAWGAFAAQTGKIYLSESLVTGDPAQLRAVLLEEVGHYLDAVVNAKDTPGDEGALFSAIVRGINVSADQMKRLREENDQAVIVVHGQTVTVEQALSLVGKWDRLSYADAVTVVGNYAYAVGDVLEIIDISNPSNPIFKGNYQKC